MQKLKFLATMLLPSLAFASEIQKEDTLDKDDIDNLDLMNSTMLSFVFSQSICGISLMFSPTFIIYT